MKLRCRSCGGVLGLGVQSTRVWIPHRWWFVTYRFCGTSCRERHEKLKASERDDKKAIAALYRPP